MPPEVGKAGPRPITQNEGTQEVSSTQVEKQAPEKQKDAIKNEAAPPRQATEKEGAHKRGDVARQASYQRKDLERKLNDQIISGTSGNDYIHISKGRGLTGKLGLYELKVNGKVQYVTKEQLKHTQIQAGAGKDRIIVDRNVDVGVKIDGGSGDDRIIGGSGDDQLSGGKGKDYIDGRRGKDKNVGGPGRDYVKFDWEDFFGKSKKK